MRGSEWLLANANIIQPKNSDKTLWDSTDVSTTESTIINKSLLNRDMAGWERWDGGGWWVCGERGQRLTEQKEKKIKGEGEGRRKKGCVLRVKGEAVYLLVCDHGVPAYMHQLPMLHYLREKLNWCRSLEVWWNRQPNLCWVTACRCQTHQRRSHFTMQLPAWVSGMKYEHSI